MTRTTSQRRSGNAFARCLHATHLSLAGALAANLALNACATTSTPAAAAALAGKEPGVTFAEDLEFLRSHTTVALLQSRDGRAQVIVAPEYQGRVMTSTASGGSGTSFGYIHREFIAKGERVPHINVFGGEDRFWLGPEAGQYGLYFAPGTPFDLANWQTPEAIDWGPWQVDAQTPSELSVSRDIDLQNHSGHRFKLHVDRKVRVLERDALNTALGTTLPAGLDVVGYESDNTIRNTGESGWTKQSGLLSIWILGMYNPSPKNTVVIPYKIGGVTELGPIVNDAYFGKIPEDRLHIADGVLFFRGDGAQRGKIGISRARVQPVIGAYDAERRALTLVQFTLPEGATDYVNSMWSMQQQPFAGDVVNSYNDGPLEPGKPPLGPFFELETSSPAAALGPGESLSHVHRTVHITGERAGLDAVAQRMFGVSLKTIESQF